MALARPLPLRGWGMAPWLTLVIAILSLGIEGCSLAPAYVKPALTAPTPDSYKEAGSWTPASPADAEPRGAWWQVYADPTLDGLEQRIEHDNQIVRMQPVPI